MIYSWCLFSVALCLFPAGVWKTRDELKSIRCSQALFQPKESIKHKYSQTFHEWKEAVKRSRNWYDTWPPGASVLRFHAKSREMIVCLGTTPGEWAPFSRSGSFKAHISQSRLGKILRRYSQASQTHEFQRKQTRTFPPALENCNAGDLVQNPFSAESKMAGMFRLNPGLGLWTNGPRRLRASGRAWILIST